MTEELEAIVRNNRAVPYSTPPINWSIELEDAYVHYAIVAQSRNSPVLNRHTWNRYISRNEASTGEPPVPVPVPEPAEEAQQDAFDYRSATTEQVLQRIQSEVVSAFESSSLSSNTETALEEVEAPPSEETLMRRRYNDYILTQPFGAVPSSYEEFRSFNTTLTTSFMPGVGTDVALPIDPSSTVGQTIANVSRATERLANQQALYNEYIQRLPEGLTPISLEEFGQRSRAHDASSMMPDIDVDLDADMGRIGAHRTARYSPDTNYENYRRSMGMEIGRLPRSGSPVGNYGGIASAEQFSRGATQAQSPFTPEEIQERFNAGVAERREERERRITAIDGLNAEAAETEAQIAESTTTLEVHNLNRSLEGIQTTIQFEQRALAELDAQETERTTRPLADGGLTLQGDLMTQQGAGGGGGVGVQLNRQFPQPPPIRRGLVGMDVMRARAEAQQAPIGVTATQIQTGTITTDAVRAHDFFSTHSTAIDAINYSFTPPKRFKFDPEQITNTVTMLRAFQAVLDKFTFDSAEIQRLGITDLVAEDTSTRVRDWSH